eukprot:799783-Rhodomonas_salina.1
MLGAVWTCVGARVCGGRGWGSAESRLGPAGYQALLNMSYEGDANRTRDWQGYLDRVRAYSASAVGSCGFGR